MVGGGEADLGPYIVYLSQVLWRNVEPVLANNGDNGGTHNEDNGTTVERTTKTTTTTDKSTRRGSADLMDARLERGGVAPA